MTTLLEKVEEYLSRTKARPTPFGQAAMNDPGFVPGLRSGRRPNEQTVKTVTDFMAQNPDGIPERVKI